MKHVVTLIVNGEAPETLVRSADTLLEVLRDKLRKALFETPVVATTVSIVVLGQVVAANQIIGGMMVLLNVINLRR